MLETSLVPQNSIITTKGDGEPVDLSDAGSRIFLVTLDITRIVEQESFELLILGSHDGQNWGAKPLLAFPQQFYAGKTPMLLDLNSNAEIRFVRAHWEVNRWGRGPETPSFEVSILLKEVPAELLV